MAKTPSKKPEFLRKWLVALKRKPQMIAMVVLVVAFVYYSLNLTQVSNTTAKIYGNGMGLAEFATMLLSILSLVCFLNAFPHRKKTNIPMLLLMFLMVGIIIYCDIFYGNRISEAVNRAENPISAEGANIFISNAAAMLKVHTVLLIIGAALTALLPLYRPLIKKINTSVEVAGNEEMGTIDISGEDA
jgi:phosphoglycerol transferase MdoB-like AlkP superfamily enzyme